MDLAEHGVNIWIGFIWLRIINQMQIAEQGVNIWIGFIWLRIINQMCQSTPTDLLQIQQYCIRYMFWFFEVIIGPITE
jgi:multisubunit Na+/H+ antiporter MnhE subunit